MREEIHETFMQKALDISRKGRLIAPPNPWVGCILVKNDKIIAEGYTHSPGQDHAEIDALKKVGFNAKGAIAYITLEPCAHQGRTPPCVEALIQAEISEAVISIEDPDPLVKGKGIRRLRDAGIKVTSGICRQKTEELLRPYLFHRKTGFPYCVAKAAVSIDGRIAAKDGSSKWISSEEARQDAHRIRAESQAILIGSGTALKDQPQLTVRHVGIEKQPLRVVLDTKGTVSAEGPLFDCKQAPTLLFTGPHSKRIVEWRQAGAEVEIVPVNEEGVVLAKVLESLGKRGILQLLIEGGSTLQSNFMRSCLIQEWIIYKGNCFLGDAGKPLIINHLEESIEKTPRYTLIDCMLFGDTVRMKYRHI